MVFIGYTDNDYYCAKIVLVFFMINWILIRTIPPPWKSGT